MSRQTVYLSGDLHFKGCPFDLNDNEAVIGSQS